MSFSIDRFIEALNASFETITITYQELNYNGKIPVFFVRCNSLDELVVNWTKLVDLIAFDFQSQLIDEFQIWNIYIFFVRPAGIIDVLAYNNLKIKIENDTFSSRKILVEEQDSDSIIDEHIVNRNVHYSADQAASPAAKFEANPLLWSILEDKILKRQKITAEAGNVFEELVEQLKKPRT